jgi:hypothetical protein
MSPYGQGELVNNIRFNEKLRGAEPIREASSGQLRCNEERMKVNAAHL